MNILLNKGKVQRRRMTEGRASEGGVRKWGGSAVSGIKPPTMPCRFFPKCIGKPLEGMEQGRDIIPFTVREYHSDCFVEDGLGQDET